MDWTDSDYSKVEKCILKLDTEERRLNTLLAQVNLLKHGAYKIKGKKTIIETKDKLDKIVFVPPNDLSGEVMGDTYRLEQLKSIITKTNKLLGDKNE